MHKWKFYFTVLNSTSGELHLYNVSHVYWAHGVLYLPTFIATVQKENESPTGDCSCLLYFGS